MSPSSTFRRDAYDTTYVCSVRVDVAAGIRGRDTFRRTTRPHLYQGYKDLGQKLIYVRSWFARDKQSIALPVFFLAVGNLCWLRHKLLE